MNRIFKAVTALILTLCIFAGTLIFAACKEDTPTYTVNILYPDGKGVAGVEVTLSPEDGTAYDNEEEPLISTTNENGAAVFDIAEWSDTAAYSVVVDDSSISSSYTLQTFYSVNVKDGYTLNLTLKKLNFDNISVNLPNKNATIEYKPKSEFADGFYEFKCSDPTVRFTLTDGDEAHPASFNLTEGCSAALVYYKKGVVYDIGTATDTTEFNLVFTPATTTGKDKDSAHILDISKTVVLNIGAGDKVYLSNPAEVDIPGSLAGGVPCVVSGSNFKATVDGTDYTQEFKLSSGKIVELTTADGKEGTVVLSANSIGLNAENLEVGKSVQIQIELMERTITNHEGTTTSLLWEVSACGLRFNIPEAGTYKFTFTSSLEADKLSVYSIISSGSISVVPARTDINYGENENDEASNPYSATYEFTAANISAVKNYSISFISEFSKFNEGYKAGDKITYTVTLEKI